MVIFVVAIPKTIPHGRAPIESGLSGNPNPAGRLCCRVWGHSNGDGSPKNDPFAFGRLYGSGAFAHHTAWGCRGGAGWTREPPVSGLLPGVAIRNRHAEQRLLFLHRLDAKLLC